MALPRQTVALLQAARQLYVELPADAVLLLTETDLDWSTVREQLSDCRLLVAAENAELNESFKQNPELTVIEFEPSRASTKERISLALLEAVRNEQLAPRCRRGRALQRHRGVRRRSRAGG